MAEADDNDRAQIERLLAQIEESNPSVKGIVGEIRRLIRGLTPRSAAVAAPRRRTGADTEYRVEGTGGQAALAEYRPSGQPLRVPKHAYDLVVDVLAAAERPLPFDELMMLMRDYVDPPADWQARVILRYLLRAQPEIIRRSRSRYQSVQPKTCRRTAEKWWKETAQRSRPA